jgi:hypothetical protein
MPDGRLGRVSVYDPEHQKLAVEPLPWYIRAIRRALGKPNTAHYFGPAVTQAPPPIDCPKGHGADV